MRQTVDLLKFTAARQQTAVTVTAAGDDFKAFVDAGQLQQVFSNVIVNALQSLSKDGQVNIRLSEEQATPPPEVDARSGAYFRIDIQDTGPGIPIAEREQIL